jgi:hypothetical protein
MRRIRRKQTRQKAAPPKSLRARNRDGRRAVFAIVCLGLILALTMFADLHKVKDDKQIAAATASSEEQVDDGPRTASILFVPYAGNTCRRNMLDNRTGAIWSVGFVACDEALAQSNNAESRQWSAARMEALRSGFRR